MPCGVLGEFTSQKKAAVETSGGLGDTGTMFYTFVRLFRTSSFWDVSPDTANRTETSQLHAGSLLTF
ncbi:hypothetical protein EYF80_055703 [Liparis tanakae]|uniref:Uncharacterized protein n=1 Tax=Liparis tanakae TaxID=230148 RepID=A0A4Z2EZ44_9TELE|nr:hypothetical protein EYF80_055703 [Liparis tanakae]